MTRTHEELMALFARRSELVSRFNATTDLSERATICRALDATFERRVDWHRRHSASYGYAKKHGLIQPRRPGGAKRPETDDPFIPVVVQMSKARDAIHRHAVARKLTMQDELALFDNLRDMVRRRKTVKHALAELIGEAVL